MLTFKQMAGDELLQLKYTRTQGEQALLQEPGAREFGNRFHYIPLLNIIVNIQRYSQIGYGVSASIARSHFKSTITGQSRVQLPVSEDML